MGRSIVTQHPQTSAVTDVAEPEAQPRWPGPAAPGRGPSEPPQVRSRSHVQEPRGGSQDRLHGIWGEQSEPVSQLLTPKGLLWLCVKARLARDLGGRPIWPRPRPVMALISCRGSGRPHGSLPGLPPLLPRGAAPARRCPGVRRRPGGCAAAPRVRTATAADRRFTRARCAGRGPGCGRPAGVTAAHTVVTWL